MITVFTPVYNRAYIIDKLYESLKLQTFKDFEWLIVNDGSSDNISEVVNTFIDEGILKIRFYTQVNGGKHRAINKGVSLANGELFFIVDSDDTIKHDALELLDKHYQQIKNIDEFAGVAGYRCDTKGRNVYKFRLKETLDCTSLEYSYKFHQIGGLAEAFKTQVLKNYPFPDFPGEKFCAESLVWNRIALKHKLRIFPEDIYVWNYLEDGLTKGSIKNRIKCPTYATTIYSELLNDPIPFKRKMKSAINYWRFYWCKSSNNKPKVSIRWYVFSLVGLFLHIMDKRRVETT